MKEAQRLYGPEGLVRVARAAHLQAPGSEALRDWLEKAGGGSGG